jgi:hypothetical protein
LLDELERNTLLLHDWNDIGEVGVKDWGTVGSIDMTSDLGDALVESKDFLGFSKVIDSHNFSGHLGFENLVLILSTREGIGHSDVLGRDLVEVGLESGVGGSQVSNLVLLISNNNGSIVKFNSGSVELVVKIGNVLVTGIDLTKKGGIGLLQLGTLSLDGSEGGLKVRAIMSAGIELVGEFSVGGGQESQLGLEALVGLVELGTPGLRC